MRSSTKDKLIVTLSVILMLLYGAASWYTIVIDLEPVWFFALMTILSPFAAILTAFLIVAFIDHRIDAHADDKRRRKQERELNAEIAEETNRIYQQGKKEDWDYARLAAKKLVDDRRREREIQNIKDKIHWIDQMLDAYTKNKHNLIGLLAEYGAVTPQVERCPANGTGKE